MTISALKSWAIGAADRHIHWLVMALFSIGVFAFVMIMNPATLTFFSLAQVACDLPEHTKCTAKPPSLADD
jgi:hypothetical protein